jgi:hypothetical protein
MDLAGAAGVTDAAGVMDADGATAVVDMVTADVDMVTVDGATDMVADDLVTAGLDGLDMGE